MYAPSRPVEAWPGKTSVNQREEYIPDGKWLAKKLGLAARESAIRGSSVLLNFPA
jgi:hypothetical protein